MPHNLAKLQIAEFSRTALVIYGAAYNQLQHSNSINEGVFAPNAA